MFNKAAFYWFIKGFFSKETNEMSTKTVYNSIDYLTQHQSRKSPIQLFKAKTSHQSLDTKNMTFGHLTISVL